MIDDGGGDSLAGGRCGCRWSWCGDL